MPEEQKAVDPAIFKLKNVRLVWPHLFHPKAAIDEGKDAKFQATFILDKEEHAAAIKDLEKLIDRIALDKFKKKLPLKHKCLRDGNEKADKEGFGDEVMFVPASEEVRPVVVDRQLNPLTKEDSKIYGGCYVNATIRLYAWEHKTGGRGVSAGLRAVQFFKDGPSIGAGPIRAEDEFEKVDGDAMDEF